MSGGSFDYFCYRMEEVSRQIYQKYTKEEKIVSSLMKDFAKVMHDLEWWKSGDIGEEDFLKTFNRFRKKWLKKEAKK